ncbi:family transcriptional regulator [Trichoderma arundinaceum]|uniref:Family transcriptional regulator n=1 Tax=Trichoderma arundinaceum TaxID=490622 RepID=A0A395NPQ7_TRIAR|nr:family transcriptional regulator [Trichoderma arundinaceum]
MAQAPIKRVCLIGANGTLGSVILKELVQASCFDVSILQRTTSSSSAAALAPSTTRIPIAPDLSVEDLTEALAGQDAVIAAFPLGEGDQHLRLVEAAFRAGVKRFIPADFGSCDASDPEPQKYLPLYRRKTLVREKCEALAEKAARDGSAFSWTTLVCGHFFDHGLRDGLLHFDFETRTAQILDGGATKASTSTLRRIAEATVRVLQRADQTRNRAIYIQSFNPTQLEVLAALEKAMGEPWHAQHIDSKPYLEDAQKRLESSDAEAVLVAIEDIVFVLGALDADWTKRDGFGMELLGLEDEKLEDVVEAVVAAYRAETV